MKFSVQLTVAIASFAAVSANCPAGEMYISQGACVGIPGYCAPGLARNKNAMCCKSKETVDATTQMCVAVQCASGTSVNSDGNCVNLLDSSTPTGTVISEHTEIHATNTKGINVSTVSGVFASLAATATQTSHVSLVPSSLSSSVGTVSSMFVYALGATLVFIC